MNVTVSADARAEAATHSVMDHSDRCDRCGAQAFIKAIFPVGELMFCAHHGREFNKPLAEAALLIQDFSDTINVKPSVAAF